MKKKVLALVALLLAACLGLQGCMAITLGYLLGKAAKSDDYDDEFYWDPDLDLDDDFVWDDGLDLDEDLDWGEDSDAALSAGDEALIRIQSYGIRDYLEDVPVEMVPFDQMEYTHPDMDALRQAFGQVVDLAETGDTGEILEAYYRAYDLYIDFYTMDTLSNIRYTIDVTDAFYQEEYDYCEAQSPEVEELLEQCYKAMAASPKRNALELRYFGPGYFETYDDYEVYTNEAYLALAQQEQELITQYHTLLEDPTVEFKGKEESFWELEESVSNHSDYIALLQSYYNKYNPLIAEVYLQLVRVRQKMAAELGYDSYADYAYDYEYGRDYTPAQGQDFARRIQEELGPVYEELASSSLYYSLSHSPVGEATTRRFVKSAAANLGGTVADAYAFMEAYALSDITQAAQKMDTSYQTYIYGYESPFVMVNSAGDTTDLTTFAHEFGHFTDAYYNYGANEDLETAETFSQAMEFLALCYADTLDDETRQELLQLKLIDIVETFVYQAAYASFEDQVYAQDADTLTVEDLNAIYQSVCKDFGIYDRDYDFYYTLGWVDIPHFFESPLYIISYCVSADTSLQVYRLEAQQAGDGKDAYFRLLDRPYGVGVQTVMDEAGLDNPFRDGSLEEVGDFIRQELDLR